MIAVARLPFTQFPANQFRFTLRYKISGWYPFDDTPLGTLWVNFLKKYFKLRIWKQVTKLPVRMFCEVHSDGSEKNSLQRSYVVQRRSEVTFNWVDLRSNLHSAVRPSSLNDLLRCLQQRHLLSSRDSSQINTPATLEKPSGKSEDSTARRKYPKNLDESIWSI